MSVGQLKGTAMAIALQMSVDREAELLEHDQKRSKDFSTPSHVSSELWLSLLRERTL